MINAKLTDHNIDLIICSLKSSVAVLSQHDGNDDIVTDMRQLIQNFEKALNASRVCNGTVIIDDTKEPVEQVTEEVHCGCEDCFHPDDNEEVIGCDCCCPDHNQDFVLGGPDCTECNCHD